jgi:alcohol dehydrogenase (cytochrome c)/quinohemoprotein ethanol dehydrogenase
MTTGRPVETPEARYNQTGKFFRSLQNPNGAHTWHSMSYSPITGLMYIPIHSAEFVYGHDAGFKPQRMRANLGVDFSGNAPADAKAAEAALASAQGRLIAWNPVTQAEVWRVERAGPANGGALSTSGGLVFQGTGSGEFTALDARTGQALWSSPTQTGVMAAPVSYEVDGKQYVAIMVGSGGSWGVVGGDANIKGNNLPNISRLLVFSLGGTATLPPAQPRPERKLSPPPAAASAATVGAGASAYGAYCSQCHGAGAVNLGILPDLRYSPALQSAETWQNIVMTGALEDGGMASFAPVLDNETSEAIRAFVIAQANATR